VLCFTAHCTTPYHRHNYSIVALYSADVEHSSHPTVQYILSNNTVYNAPRPLEAVFSLKPIQNIKQMPEPPGASDLLQPFELYCTVARGSTVLHTVLSPPVLLYEYYEGYSTS